MRTEKLTPMCQNCIGKKKSITYKYKYVQHKAPKETGIIISHLCLYLELRFNASRPDKGNSKVLTRLHNLVHLKFEVISFKSVWDIKEI